MLNCLKFAVSFYPRACDFPVLFAKYLLSFKFFGVCIPRSSNCRYPSIYCKQPLQFSADFYKVDCVGMI